MNGLEMVLERSREIASRIHELVQNYDFSDFWIGIRLPNELDKLPIEEKQKIKREIARRVGKKLAELLGKEPNFSNPDLTIILDFRKDPRKPEIIIQIKPLYIYGEYKKLERGIPQTKWICMKCKGKGCPHCQFMGKLYPTSVEEEIGKPLLDLTGGTGTKFHGAGREDRDALMLGWRPFVIEILNPIVRNIDLHRAENIINHNEKVKVRHLKFTNKEEIVKLKEAKFDKTYEALVECPGYTRDDLEALQKTFDNIVIDQLTPKRVSHRRAKKVRKRRIYFVECEPVDSNVFKAKIKAESGTYIKELVSGDEGRTKPSFSQVIGKPCKVIELNVLEVHSN